MLYIGGCVRVGSCHSKFGKLKAGVGFGVSPDPSQAPRDDSAHQESRKKDCGASGISLHHSIKIMFDAQAKAQASNTETQSIQTVEQPLKASVAPPAESKCMQEILRHFPSTQYLPPGTSLQVPKQAKVIELDPKVLIEKSRDKLATGGLQATVAESSMEGQNELPLERSGEEWKAALAVGRRSAD